ncbi:hypothetical protein Tco_1422042 [Tanacetum coccineum]
MLTIMDPMMTAPAEAIIIAEYPDQIADEGDERNKESTGRGSTSGHSWNNWSKKFLSEHIMGDRQAHLASIKDNLVDGRQRGKKRETRQDLSEGNSPYK